MNSNELLSDKTFAFAVRVLVLQKNMSEENKTNEITREFVRAGTVQGAIVREVNYAQSFEDAIDILKRTQKEVIDTRYWLDLLLFSEMISEDEFNSIDKDAQNILSLITKVMLTQQNRNSYNDN